jgi:iron complex outermembrane receptor protein
MLRIVDRPVRLARRIRLGSRIALLPLVTALSTIDLQAQGGATPQQPPSAPAGRIQVPPVTVTAQKEPAPAERLPVSVTAIDGDRLGSGGISALSDLAGLAPNTYFSELSARKISNARFRGIGSSPANPGISTFIDGVPQLNTNTANLEWLDVDQVEFVRGAQSALFGRNTLGGVITLTSRRPSLTSWTGRVSQPMATENDRSLRAAMSGPVVAGRLGMSAAVGYSQRDGFSRNILTGHTVDDRSAFFGKAQLLWKPSEQWEARVIVGGERDRDGDYALADLDRVRVDPWRVVRDYEGRTERDVLSTTVLTRREGSRLTWSTVTGLVRWDARDRTDLDYTPSPLSRRDNREKALQFSQELRVASAAAAPLRLSSRVRLAWQTGVFAFTQDYDQSAVNQLAPFVISPLLGIPIDQHSPEAALNDSGVGVFGQATALVGERLDLSVGLRADHENRKAELETFFAPPLPVLPASSVDDERRFTSVSPQLSATYRLRDDRMVYGSVGRGFKAGGFNPASPAGSETYDEEHAWHVEAGTKSFWADRRMSTTASVFFIDWQDLQLNLPDPAVPAQFFISNVGNARSRGAELEFNARLHESLSLLGAFGYTHARFGEDSRSSGVPVAGHKLPLTPEFTSMVGVEVTRSVRTASLFGRVEVTAFGGFEYDDLNTARQDAYALTDVRVGVRAHRFFAEAWLRNAFDTRYVPVALAYDPRVAPSGFVGEPGHPRRFGISLGAEF